MKTIFVIDDNRINLLITEEVLSHQYDVITMNSASVMFSLIDKVMPDLILLDIMMPEIDGFEAIKRLKANERYRHIPVIFLTGKKDNDSEVLGFELGAVDFISKPLSAPILLNRIKYILHIEAVINERLEQLPRKRNMDSLENTVTKLSLAMKAGKICMWDMEIDMDNPLNPGNEVNWSDDFRYMLGCESEADFPNRVDSLINVIYPDDLANVNQSFINHIMDTSGKTPYNIEYRIIKKNGEIINIHATCEAIRDEQGNPLRVSGTIINITETKNLIKSLEAAVAEAQKATLAKNNTVKTLENILDNLDGQIYTTDPVTNKILFINKVLRNFFGIVGDEALGRHCYEVFRGRDKKCENCPCYMLDKHPDQSVIWEEYLPELGRHIRHADRYIDWVDGNKVHLQLAVDITELVKAKEEAERQRQEAEMANRTKSEFLSHISHEIRTPMNAILGTAEIQLQKEIHSPETEEAFGIIYGSGNLLLNIINDILDLSKIEAGKLEILPIRYDILGLVYDTMQLNLLRYDSKPIEFDIKINEHTPFYMFGDELRIKQILNNIISNAFKYTDNGKVELSVFAEHEDNVIDKSAKAHTPCTLVVQVSDTGYGMTEEQMNKLFEEYTRFHLNINRAIVGTGLGMHITKRLLDAMNGEITVSSVHGEGSRFTVKIPQMFVGNKICGPDMVNQLYSNRFKSKLKLRQSQIISEYMPYGSVLVVDDVESNLYVAKGMMLPYGLKIETLVSGFDAIEKIKNGNVYDIIFMDHMMPRIDGIETTRRLREMGYAHPIVALTANAVVGSSKMFLSNGFDGYISKPIDIRELNNSLNRLIRDKQPPEVIEAALKGANQSPHTTAAQPGRSTVSENKIKEATLRDIENAITVLKGLLSSLNASGKMDTELFTTTVHGMKSALANINETELSNTALSLEKLGQAGKMSSILVETPSFISALTALTKIIKSTEEAETEEFSDDSLTLLRKKLAIIKTACEHIKRKTAKTVLDELQGKTWPREIKNLLDDLSDDLLLGEFKKAAARIDAVLMR
jgi:PAS domain S-box-containing protein